MNSMRQTLYFNVVVLTMNEDQPEVGAVLTEGERIVQVGNYRDIADHRRIRWGFKPSPRRIPLPTPALRRGLADATKPQLDDCVSVADLDEGRRRGGAETPLYLFHDKPSSQNHRRKTGRRGMQSEECPIDWIRADQFRKIRSNSRLPSTVFVDEPVVGCLWRRTNTSPSSQSSRNSDVRSV